ncbi:hypothetical protein BDF14DRAFT_1858531 [Spinellus fusiger]|nr:hypothetical protein BDF14DRAFT_1858531 [Spinellus fusiger]
MKSCANISLDALEITPIPDILDVHKENNNNLHYIHTLFSFLFDAHSLPILHLFTLSTKYIHTHIPPPSFITTQILLDIHILFNVSYTFLERERERGGKKKMIIKESMMEK